MIVIVFTFFVGVTIRECPGVTVSVESYVYFLEEFFKALKMIRVLYLQSFWYSENISIKNHYIPNNSKLASKYLK